MPVLSPEVIDEIIHEWKKTPSPFKVAKKLGLNFRDVWDVIDSNEDRLVAHAEVYGGEGRPEMLKYRVGRIRAYEHWDNTDVSIALARQNFEAGVVDLITGRDGAFLLLYAIPRRHKQPRPDYFKLEM